MEQTIKKWEDVWEKIRPPCQLCKKEMVLYGPLVFPPSDKKRYYWRCRNHGCTRVLNEMTPGETKMLVDFIERTIKNPVRKDDGLLDYMYGKQLTNARMLNGDTPVVVDCAHGSEDTQKYLDTCPVDGTLMKVLYVPGTTWLACCKKECYDIYLKARP
jgi:hypothetical protein